MECKECKELKRKLRINEKVNKMLIKETKLLLNKISRYLSQQGNNTNVQL